MAGAYQGDAAREYQRKYYLEHREQKLAYSRANQARVNQRRRELNAARVIGGARSQNLDARCHNCNILYEYERGRLR